MEYNLNDEVDFAQDSGDESEIDDLSECPSDIEEEKGSGDDDTCEDEENAEGLQSCAENHTFMLGKDKNTKWYRIPQRRYGCTTKTTEVIDNDDRVHPAIPTHSVSSTFQFFLTDHIINKTVDATNQNGVRKFGDAWERTDDIEIKAWIGLHIRAGLNKDGFRPLTELFSGKDGPPIYGACMGRERFQALKNTIRFDDADSRAVRRSGETEGSLAPIHEVFSMFMEACNVNYKPGKYLTIDESLVPFRGRCSFKVYMPKKPDKYGIKIWTMADATNSYLCNAQIYRGKQKDVPEVGLSQRVVKDLVSNVQGSGRNITVDNFFSSVPLAKELLSRDLTMIGTIRKNKVEIPPCFQASKTRDVYSTEFGFGQEGKIMLCSYVPRKRKAVTMISSYHHEKKVEPLPPCKPSLITDYNKTKGSIDTLDQLVKNYTCKRVTNRWPLLIFYWIIDVGCYNASVCFMSKQPTIYVGKQKRRKFLMDLSEELVMPLILRRSHSQGFRKLHKETLTKMALFLPEDLAQQQQFTENQRKRCSKCPRGMDKKTRKICSKCCTPLCENHRIIVCSECA